MRRDETVVAAALIVAGLLTIAVAIPRYVASSPLGGELSPAFMPYVAAALATLAALGMLVTSLRRDSSRDGPRLTAGNLCFLGASAAVLAAGYALMSFAGYVVGGAVLVAGLLLMARVKLLAVVIGALVAPAAVWLLFARLLAMPLP